MKTKLALSLVSILMSVYSCKKSGQSNVNGKDTVAVKPKTVLNLPERQVKVYIGISDRWHEMEDPSNYNSWKYVRTSATGFYTNFIAMWVNSYQNNEDPQESCNKMRNAFTHNGCFFETSLETKVNDDATGGNNETTDKKYIDQLTNAGFVVDNTSLNYGIDAQRVNTLKTYRNQRNCLTLIGPWLLGGNIQSDATSGNAQLRQNILATDGAETDWVLGFWFGNTSNIREGSYSVASFARQKQKLSAIMLAPADGGMTTYNPTTDFFNTAKACVFGHEDTNTAPDMWTIWTYGERSDEPTFPESVVNSNGESQPANTLTGVGYWLLKHLNNQPKLQPKDTGTVNSATKVHSLTNSSAQLTMNNSAGNTTYSMPVIISNDADPQIELSPVVNAAITGGTSDWNISFSLGGSDVTDDVVYNGGINCIKALRLSKTNKLTLFMNIKNKVTNAAPLTIKIKTMSNISNTANAGLYTITAQVL
jgi:hypothetical protein